MSEVTFELELLNLREKLKKYIEEGRKLHQESIKNSILFPLLGLLNYDVTDLDDVECEFGADMRRHGGDKADCVLKSNNTPYILIEVKSYGTNLDHQIGQLKGYYVAVNSVKYGVLTDGKKFMFFDDATSAGIMDDTPFYVLDLLNITDVDIKFLQYFAKGSLFNTTELLEFKQSLRLKNFILNNIVNPSDDFIKYVDTCVGCNVTKSDYVKALNSLTADLDTSDNLANSAIENSVKESKDFSILNESYPRGVVGSKYAVVEPNAYTILGVKKDFNSWIDLCIDTLKCIESVSNNVDVFEAVYARFKNNSYFRLIANEAEKTSFIAISKTAQSQRTGFKQYDTDGREVFITAGAKRIHEVCVKVLKLFNYSERDLIYHYN